MLLHSTDINDQKKIRNLRDTSKENLYAAVVLTFAFTITAGTASFGGSLNPSNPLWDGCGSGTGCNSDVLASPVITDGLYDISTLYPGGVTFQENLDVIIS